MSSTAYAEAEWTFPTPTDVIGDIWMTMVTALTYAGAVIETAVIRPSRHKTHGQRIAEAAMASTSQNMLCGSGFGRR
jgi:hypothetical protein